MNILLPVLLLMQAASGAPAPETPAGEDAVKEQIILIGERLKTWQGGIYKREGDLTCRIGKGTGDLEIDAIRCGALIECFAPLADPMDAVYASDLPEADRNRQMQEIAATATPCIDQFHVTQTVKLARKRAAEQWPGR